MASLAAAVIPIQADSELLAKTSASAIRAWLLNNVEAIRPDLMPQLRAGARNMQPVPYTISAPLRDAQIGAYVRLTALTQSVADMLLHDVLTTLPQSAVWDETPVQLGVAITDSAEHRDAGTDDYTAIVARAYQRSLSTRIDCRILSPVSFRSNGANVPFPSPLYFFGSLYQRWNAFTEDSLTEPILPFVEHSIFVARYNMRSVYYENRWLGGIGTIRYQMRLPAQASPFPPMTMMLSDFAFFAGVGIKTTYGMGQVRVASA